jgi:hypothetical protein
LLLSKCPRTGPNNEREIIFTSLVTVKTAIAFTPENANTLSWWSELIVLPTEELINFCLAEYLQDFNKNNDGSFPEQALGLLKFKDRISAERTLEWVKSRVLKGPNGQVPDV